MYQKPTVPRDVGGVLDDGIQLYKASLRSCWLPALLASLVTGALSYSVFRSMPQLTAAMPPADLMARYRGLAGAFGIWYLVVFAINLALYGTLVVNIVAVSRGETPAFGASLAKAMRRWPALLVASITVSICLVVGFILLLIPGLYVWNRLQLYLVPLVGEGQWPFKSRGASWRAVAGNGGRTAAVVGVMFVILLVVSLIVGALSGFIAAFAGIGTKTVIASPTALVIRVQLMSQLVGAIVRIFTTPLIFSAFVALYQDLLLRKGGADLEARLGALPQG